MHMTKHGPLRDGVPLAKKLGDPWLSFSVTPSIARQCRRTPSNGTRS